MTADIAYQHEISPDHERRAHRLMLTAGVWYGVFFGLSFAIVAWGYDAYLLVSNGAAFPWIKLLLGLPLAVISGGTVGWLAAYTNSVALSVVVWAVYGALLGVVSGHIPFDGGNLIYWASDRRLWGEIILSYGDSAAVRTNLVIFINAVVGAAAGLVESVAVQWAWDRATSQGKMSFGSLMVLLVGVPLALVMAATVNGFINRPLRFPQQAVGELVSVALTGEIANMESLQSSYRSIKPYQDAMTDRYESHFVKFQMDTGTWDSAYIDVDFDNGFVMRCATILDRVVYCDNFSQRITDWIEELVRAGLYGERPWLEADIKRLMVHESVVDWLGAHRDQLSETYEWKKQAQYADWFYISIQFDTGFEMVCRFREATPVLLDQCVETSPASNSE